MSERLYKCQRQNLHSLKFTEKSWIRLILRKRALFTEGSQFHGCQDRGNMSIVVTKLTVPATVDG